jgi:hypothetical protein
MASKDVNDHRGAAAFEMMMAIKDIADKHGICRLCLGLFIFNHIQRSAADGKLEHNEDRHYGDEYETTGNA